MEQVYTLEDLRGQIKRFRESGMDTFSAISDFSPSDLLELEHSERILEAMTAEERSNPDLLDEQDRQRIALLSNTQPTEVAELISQLAKIQIIFHEVKRLSNYQ